MPPVCAWPDQLSSHTSRTDKFVLLEDNHGSTAQTFPSMIEAAGLFVSPLARRWNFHKVYWRSKGTAKVDE